MTKYEFKWEEISEETYRARIMGGWLILHKSSNNKGVSESLTFCPDRHHEWIILPPKQTKELNNVKEKK
jgi:hypothetical protein